MNRSRALEERKSAVAEYRRTKSVVETVRNLGYPGLWTMYTPLDSTRIPTTARSAQLQRYVSSGRGFFLQGLGAAVIELHYF